MKRWLLALCGVLLPAAALALTPTLDGTAAGTGTASSGTTVAVAATTTTTNDVIVVGVDIRGLTATTPTPAIAGCSLSWTSIKLYQASQGSVGHAVQAWWAKSAGLLSACTITITSDVTIGGAVVGYCGFKDAYTAAPLDLNPALPGLATNATASTVLMSGTVTTLNANDLGIAIMGQGSVNMGGITTTPQTICANNTNAGGLRFDSLYMIYATYTTKQSATSISLSTNQPWWGIITTALTADAPPGGGGLSILGVGQ